MEIEHTSYSSYGCADFRGCSIVHKEVLGENTTWFVIFDIASVTLSSVVRCLMSVNVDLRRMSKHQKKGETYASWSKSAGEKCFLRIGSNSRKLFGECENDSLVVRCGSC